MQKLSEQFENLQPVDDGGFYKEDKALYGYRAPRLWKDAVAKVAKEHRLEQSKIDNSLCMDKQNLLEIVHVDDEILSRGDKIVRDMMQKFESKIPDEENHLSRISDTIEILGRTVKRTNLGYRLITSSRHADQSLKDMVSTPALRVTQIGLATEEHVSTVLAGLYRRVTRRLLYVAGQRPEAQQAVKELARGMSSTTKDSLDTPEKIHAVPGEQTSQHLEVRADGQRSARQRAYSHTRQ